jgi:hypothetical protein
VEQGLVDVGREREKGGEWLPSWRRGEEEDTGLRSFRTEKNDDMKKKLT